MRAILLATLLLLLVAPAASAGPLDSVVDRAERVPYCLEYRPTVGCVLGVEPDPVACLLNYIRTHTPCR